MMHSSPDWCWRSTSCARRGAAACGCVCPSSTRRQLRSPLVTASPFTTPKEVQQLKPVESSKGDTQPAVPSGPEGSKRSTQLDPLSCQAMLLRWLPTDAPCPVPAFATHIVGCGGLVINPKGEVLCVREKNPLRKTGWKLPGGTTICQKAVHPPAWPQPPPIDRPAPGPPRRTRPCLPPPSRLGQLRVCPPPAVAERAGLMDLGEEVGEATAREVFEETGGAPPSPRCSRCACSTAPHSAATTSTS